MLGRADPGNSAGRHHLAMGSDGKKAVKLFDTEY
jgi:hypothetical protein